MKRELVKKSIETGELQLEFWQKITHYGIVLFSFFFSIFVPVMVLFLYIKDCLTGTARLLVFEVLWFSPVFAIVGLIFYFVQKKRLKFTPIKTNLPREQIDEIIKEVSNELEWHGYKNNKKVFVAKTYPKFFSGSWGEQITILFDEDNILVNSICDPDQKSSVVSMGRNAQNIGTLIEKIESNPLKVKMIWK